MSNQGKVRILTQKCTTVSNSALGTIRLETQLCHFQAICECLNQSKVFLPIPWSRLCCRIQGQAILEDKSYNPGILLLIFVKILQRIYKYGGQPFARDFLALHYGNDFDRVFGKGTGKAIMHATAGRWEHRTETLWELDLTVAVKFDWHWRDCPPTPWRSQNQAPNKSQGIPRPGRFPDYRRWRNGTLPRCWLDCGQELPWLICST